MFEFEREATAGAARAGRWTLPHGVVETPCFMPVGTQGTVKALLPEQVRGAGFGLILGRGLQWGLLAGVFGFSMILFGSLIGSGFVLSRAGSGM